MAKTKKSIAKEKDILKSILDYLTLLENQRKLWFVRVGSGGIRTEAGHWMKTGRPGCPDIIVCLKNGLWCGLEVKSGKNTQSDAQRLVEGRIKNLGGLYFVVKSVEEAMSVLIEHIV